MGIYSKEQKEKYIKAEIKRLKKIYKDIEPNRKDSAIGLIERASFMRVSLDEMEASLNSKGFVEMFSQSETQEPYERKRLTADLYNQINGSYQKIIKQLTDLLPKEQVKNDNDDGFNSFIGDRHD